VFACRNECVGIDTLDFLQEERFITVLTSVEIFAEVSGVKDRIEIVRAGISNPTDTIVRDYFQARVAYRYVRDAKPANSELTAVTDHARSYDYPIADEAFCVTLKRTNLLLPCFVIQML
jgi:hypothetical protein